MQETTKLFQPLLRTVARQPRGSGSLSVDVFSMAAQIRGRTECFYPVSNSIDILSLTSEPALLSNNGRITFMNSAACRLLGEEYVGKKLSALLGPELASCQAASFVSCVVVNGRQYTLRLNRLQCGDAIFLSSSTASPPLINDALIYSLRSSLMNFSICADSIRDIAEEQQNKELLSNISAITHSYYKMLRVLSNAGAVMDIEAGCLAFCPCELDITDMIERTIDTLRVLVNDVHISFSNSRKVILRADAQLVELMLLNLISNCLVHGHGLSRISINLLESKESLVISVDDDGCGIAPDELGTVFDRYNHGFDVSQMQCGAGLGLSVVRGVAQMHEGTLLIESRQGVGTTVRVSLSKKLPCTSLHTPKAEWQPEIRSILTALSDYLPQSCYDERYLD